MTSALPPTSSRVKSPTWVVVATIDGPFGSAEPDAPGLAHEARASAPTVSAAPVAIAVRTRRCRGVGRVVMSRSYLLLIMIVKTMWSGCRK